MDKSGVAASIWWVLKSVLACMTFPEQRPCCIIHTSPCLPTLRRNMYPLPPPSNSHHLWDHCNAEVGVKSNRALICLRALSKAICSSEYKNTRLQNDRKHGDLSKRTSYRDWHTKWSQQRIYRHWPGFLDTKQAPRGVRFSHKYFPLCNFQIYSLKMLPLCHFGSGLCMAECHANVRMTITKLIWWMFRAGSYPPNRRSPPLG